ncbi:MAG: hypothetical protein JNL40_17395 [Cyclobacteriaceae bacterium]|nr:hypothetical protein [Cyclobacteriaceae bacterium]
MYIPFNDMPGSARLWIYQADRPFTVPERASIENDLVHLCETWKAHDVPLKTSFRIEYSQFVVLAVDERDAGASGCSIDSSVRWLKGLQQRLGIDFFNRQQVAFLADEGIALHPMGQLKTLFENGVLNARSVAFNNALTTKADWEQAWKVAAAETWLSRYLPKAAGVQNPS